jgi:hypothetical protein
MKRRRVLRFTYLSLVVGAVLGLISGLAFGGGGSESGSIAFDDDVYAPVTNPQDDEDPYAGQPMTAQRAELVGSNEMGLVLVLVYNEISPEPEDSSTRTPEQFRDDLALLESEGFFPISVGDLAAGDVDIPAGKSPVVISFDRSYPGQYRILDDGTLDPDCAVGIIRSFTEAGYWRQRATFFCLLDVVPSDNVVFGQEEHKMEKLRNLADWGFEIGSNTVTNLDLSKASAEDIKRELAQSQASLNDMLRGKATATSLALPYGHFPQDTALLAKGTFEDTTYEYTAAVGLDEGGAFTASPFSTIFASMHILRIAPAGDSLAVAIDQLKSRRELLYISDGDPTTVSAPYDLAPLLGEPRPNLGRPVVRY